MAKIVQPRPPVWEGRHYVGIDENGMGPRLGPLVVTSILARIDPELGGDRFATSRPRGGLAKRIGDSKKLVAFDDSTLGEAWARAIELRTRAEDAAPASPADSSAARRIALDDDATLRAPCPDHHVDLCWGTSGEAFTSDDAGVASCTKDLARLAAKGVDVRRVQVAIVGTRRLNDAVGAGLSRFDVDLHTMERLALDARAHAGEDILALCGKVGGFDFYGARFGPLAGRLHTVLVEGRARSDYQLPGLGRLSFLRDADESHLLVGLASLVGKWVRDHLMRRVVRWHRAHVPDAPDASGYHDPTTTRFIRLTELTRKRQKVASGCFERAALGKRGAS